MLSGEKAFISGIIKNPEDNTIRMIYADWLDGLGRELESRYAQFIRAQIRKEYYSADLLPLQIFESLLGDGCAAWSVASSSDGYFISGSKMSVMLVRGFVECVYLKISSYLKSDCVYCNGKGYNMRYAGVYNCRRCKAKGYRRSQSADLFESQPVTTVVFTDRHPRPVESHSNQIDYCWVRGGDVLPDNFNDTPNILPEQLWLQLQGFATDPSPRVYARRYGDYLSSMNALSNAAVNLARIENGYEPLVFPRPEIL